jgi:DNA-binding HxlR family transcriptional regulator
MRSYRQYCPVAKALDVVGDRWALLIVRELIFRGPSRYTDIRRGLSGIATNLLAERLRELEAAGVVKSSEAPPPVATTLYELTDRGHELEPVLTALAKWGAPFLLDEDAGDEFRTHYLSLALRANEGRSVPGPDATIEVRTGEEPMVIETRDGAISARAGTADRPDAVLVGRPLQVVGLLTGRFDVAKAEERGLEIEGDRAVVERVFARSRV